ncbi:hypothetical protein Fcan01_17527 [Folsomia candida]|uniref:DNA-directed DNA polymerase n=1 Tax=Folsomia candida TaxID=158441 RepID=A0A226DT41_FOLCA|nr:hypothetical protein Fcan01_17527 [Folsomia candida]
MKMWEEHDELFHRCICGLTFVNLQAEHTCMFRQTGEGRKNLVEASRNLQTEKLKLDRVVHRDFAFKAFYKIQCYNVPIEEPDVENPDDMKYSNKVADLLCASYGIVVVGPSNEIVFEKVYDGPNVMEDFFTEVFRIQEDAFQLLRNFMVPLRPSRTDKDNHSAAKTCPICQLPFDKKRIKVYHHNHLIPGQEILIWCGLCNIKAKQKAVVFIGHKTSHLDSHVILNSLRPELVRAATILTKGSNEIISLTIRPSQSSKARCRFIDSHRFMQEEMKNLVAQLKSKNVDAQVLKDSELPPIELFHDELTDEGLTNEQYSFMKEIFRKYCRTLGDYAELYLRRECFLLADICINYNKNGFQNFGLYPFHFTDIYNYIKSDVKGGASISCTRFAKSNSERLGLGSFNPQEPRVELLFLDCISMYPTQLLNYLAFSDYEFVPSSELELLNIGLLPENTGVGWIFEVDISYPPDEKMMDRDNYFPLGISHRELRSRRSLLYYNIFKGDRNRGPTSSDLLLLSRDDLSEDQKRIFDRMAKSNDNPFNIKRLSMDFHPKLGLKVYYTLLKYYIARGLRIDRVISALRFTEKPFCREFITHCMALREAAAAVDDKVSSKRIKGIGNSIFGKLLSDSSNYTDSKVCVSRADAISQIKKPTFKNLVVLNDDLSVFQLEKLTLRHDYNIVAGFICLDLVKLENYKMMEKLQRVLPGCKLILHETDSFLVAYPDPNKDFVKRLQSMSCDLDFSECVGTDLFNINNKGKPGKWRILHPNLKEVCSIRPKTYSLLFWCENCSSDINHLTHECESKVKASGVAASAIKKLTHHYFKKLLADEAAITVKFKTIQAKEFSPGLYETSKAAISALNFSRYLNKNKVDTTARGHIRLLRGEDL